MEEEIELERPFFNDVEALFSEYVQWFGGAVLDYLKENQTDRLNADYLFANPDVVAELKTFKKDVFGEKEDIARLLDLYQKWLDKDMMTLDEFRAYAFRGQPLPEICRRDLVDRASKTIERAIYKADKQIEETKRTFVKPSADGVLFLVNDGNYFFSNEGFLAVISSLIYRKFKDASFNVVIYITINQFTQKEGSPLDHSVWIPLYTKLDENGETIVSDELHEFVNSLGKKFQTEFMTLKTGQEPKEHTQIEDVEEALKELAKHQFIPKEIIYKK